MPKPAEITPELTPEEIGQRLLGQRLQKARTGYSYSQDYVAFKLGLTTAEIAEIEAGERRVSTLQISMLASLYGKTIKHLVLGEEDGIR